MVEIDLEDPYTKEQLDNIIEFENTMISPRNYRIVIEHEIRTFDITIFDVEQASNSLQRICKFKNHLSTECIEEAINLLKSVLLKNEFNFYFHKDGKLYKKNAEGIKRVKDIKELLNEREKRCK